MLMTVLKEKRCDYCHRVFMPARSMQRVCRLICAQRLAVSQRKEVEKAEKEAFKARREKLKRIPDLIREAQTVFNRWIRTRDEKEPCISCGAPPPDRSALHAGRDAGHYRSTGSASHLRFHEDNCHSQCVKCNQWGAGRAVEYRIGLIKRIGLAPVVVLETSNDPRKWTREELIAIKAEYSRRLKELKEKT